MNKADKVFIKNTVEETVQKTMTAVFSGFKKEIDKKFDNIDKKFEEVDFEIRRNGVLHEKNTHDIQLTAEVIMTIQGQLDRIEKNTTLH